MDDYVGRDLEQKLWNYMDSPEILAVTGPRQCGKTTLLKKIHEDLEKSRFVTFEDRDALELFEEAEKDFARLYLEDVDYLIIDEFQYAENGGKKLKYLYDMHPDKKILITGSSAAEMTVKGLKHLTGRILSFSLRPFSFSEYLRYVDGELHSLHTDYAERISGGETPEIPGTVLRRLENHRKQYTVYGGYPRVVLSESDEEKQEVLENIVDTYLLREVKEVLGIAEDRKVKELMRVLALQLGGLVRYNKVGEKTDFRYKELKDKMRILEHTFIAQRINPFFTNKQKEIVKAPKIYFYDNGFRNTLINDFRGLENRQDRGELNENFFFTQTQEEMRYWRSKAGAELDFVLRDSELKAYEVKTRPKTTKSFRSFQERYGPDKSYVMNEEKLEEGKDVLMVPLTFTKAVL